MKQADAFGTMKLYAINYPINKPILIKNVQIYLSKYEATISIFFNFDGNKFFPHIENNNTDFTNPKLKKVDDNNYILMGTYIHGDEYYLSISNFKRRLPSHYKYLMDNLEYPYNYWD